MSAPDPHYDAAASLGEIGRAMPRKEDYRLLTGHGRYLDDIVIPGALHACFLRSPHAHARIRSINTSVAAPMPGVVAVVTGRDLAEMTMTLRTAPPIEGLLPVEMTTLPIDKVRFHGDPVACVVATDRYLAEDACERIDVEYDPLPAIASVADALRPGAVLVDESLETNRISHQSFVTPDLPRAFAAAEKIVKTTFHQHRQTHAPIETRGCIAVWDQGNKHLTFHVGVQAPHPYRSQLASRLRLKETQVTVIAPDVGGGFGQKIALYREELCVAALARKLRRPVRWREDRLENLLAASHARENSAHIQAGVMRDGRIVALELELTEDFGAYSFYPGNYLARVVAMILPGAYKIQNYGFDVKVYLTNKCGNGPMRAPMAITSWLMEGTIEAIARELGLDPVEVRRINMLRADEFPYTTATGQALEDITPRETMEKALATVDYTAFRRRQAEARKGGRYIGLGVCVVVESTTYGSAFYKAAGIAGSGHEAAWVRIEPSGAVNASVGLMSTGQGYETALAQAVAEGLGVASEVVRLHTGHTDIAPYGMGSRGGRGGTAGGSVLFLTARAMQAKILAIAARLLNLNSPDELRLRKGRVERRTGGEWADAGLGLADVSRVAYLEPLRLPPGMEPGLEVHKAYDPPPMTYSNATHICEVEVDPRTGRIRIVRYVIAEDCGTVLSPVVVEGQQHGATAMGLSGALLEHVVYDETGQNLSGSFADYLLATACEMPTFEIISMHTPNRRTPTGSKGMAEGGVMGATGALPIAVNDALMPFGVAIDRQPLSSDHIRALIRDKV